MEQAKRITGHRNRWMGLGLLIGAWMICVPAAVQAEPETATAPVATPPAVETTPAPAQQEKLQAELQTALQQIELLKKKLNSQRPDPNLDWTMTVEAGF